MATLGLRIHQVATISNATSQDVNTERVDEGRKWNIERLGFRDRNSVATRVEIIIGRDGDEYQVAAQGSPTANIAFWEPGPLTLFERERLIFRFVGATLTDTVDIYVVGMEEVG